MARSKSLFKNSYNRLLQDLAKRDVGAEFGPVTRIVDLLGISGSTANALVGQLESAKIINGQGRTRKLARKPVADDYFPVDETRSAAQRLEEDFLRSIIGGNAMPGDTINELQLARKFNTSTSLVREFLIHFSRFGLIEKRPNRHWVLRGITAEFIDEVLTLREAFTLIAAAALHKTTDDAPIWLQLRSVKVRFHAFVGKKEVGPKEFQNLEREFYSLLADATKNRFIQEFTEISLTIVYYNFQIDRSWEISENKAGAEMMVSLIDAIASRDLEKGRVWTQRWIEHARSAYKAVIAANSGSEGTDPQATAKAALSIGRLTSLASDD